MATQTGSISFETQAGLNSYAKGQYATLAQVKGQFATSSTAAATAAKVATIVPADSGWELYAGATITVKFTTANDTAAPTLNVNSSGAKAIRDHAGAALTEDAYKWAAGAAMAFTYDGTYWRLQDTLPQRVSTAETAIEQNATAISLRATKTEAYQSAQPNLSPFFESTPYRTATTYDGGYWQKTSDNWLMGGVTHLSDGWAHVTRAASTKLELAIPYIDSIDSSKRYTLLFEWRDITVTGSPNLYARNYPNNCQFTSNSYNCSWNTSSPTSGTKRVSMTVDTTAKETAWTAAINLGLNNGSSASFDGDLRISLYEETQDSDGNWVQYTGPYKPYVGTQLYPTNSRMSAAETAIEQNAEAIKITATKEEVEKTYVTKDDSQLDRAGSGTAVAIDGAANAALKDLHVIGESVQDGTPTPEAPKPIYSAGPPNMVSNSEVRLVSTYESKSDTTSCVLTRTIPKGTMVTVSCHIEATNVTWAGSGSRRAGVEINQPTDGTSSGTQYVGVWWGVSGSNHQGSDANFSGTLSAQVTLTRDFVADGSRTLGVYIQNITGGSITVSEPSLTVGYFKPYVPSDSIAILVKGRNMLGLATAGRHTYVAANGITWTMNDDGTVSANGTSTGISQAYWSFGLDELLAFDGMELSGCPSVSGCSLRLEKGTSPYTAYAVDTGNGATVNIPSSDSGNAFLFCRVDSGKTVDVTFRPMIRRPSQPNEYEPYSGTVVPIPLNGHELRSLPDGTQDELTVDVDGHVTMTQRVGSVSLSSDGWSQISDSRYRRSLSPTANMGEQYSNTVCTAYGSTDNTSANQPANTIRADKAGTRAYLGAGSTLIDSEFQYPLATPQTIDLGTIDMPQVHDGDTVEVIAALTPSIDVTWWASAGQAVADAYASLSSAIEVKAESIVSTVSERYATSQEVQAISSQITQTAQGWTAQFNELTGGADLSMTLAQAFDALGVTSRNLEEIRSFVRITTDNAGDPLLLMGSATSPIMLALSNDSLRFMHGSDPVAYIDVDGTTNEGRLHITRAVVVKELQFGSWKWFERNGVGNLALKWVGDE